MHRVGSHYLTTSRQMEAYYSRISGESQNPRIRILELEEMARSPTSLGRQEPGVFIINGAVKAENAATRQQGWVCDLMSRALARLKSDLHKFLLPGRE